MNDDERDRRETLRVVEERTFGPRRSMRVLPWWRRAWAWIGDFHKFVVTLISIAGTTIVVHVWLKGLVTRAELEHSVEVAVEKAVRQALVDSRTDIEILKQRTGGVPEWRADVTDRLLKVEGKAAAAEKQGEKNEDRIDRYIAAARLGGR